MCYKLQAVAKPLCTMSTTQPLPSSPVDAHTIADVARETGIQKDTLRVWERRYGFPVPSRDAVGERRYGADQLSRLRQIKRLLDAGYRPGGVVALSPEALAQHIESLSGAAQADVRPRGARGGAVAGNAAHAVVQANLDTWMAWVRDGDVDALHQALGQHALKHGMVHTVDRLLGPLGHAVGEAWLGGTITVYQEHLYTEAVQRFLQESLVAADRQHPAPRAAPRVLLTTLPGEVHTLGLLMAECLMALAGAELLRTDVLEWARESPALRWVLPVILAAGAAALARLIVRWDPDASGSGVQRVEAVVRGQLEPDRRLRLIPAKFVGGVLAIGSGMALGREGPTVQMGASIGQEIARVTRLSAQDRGSLTASLGGAGLGVAFSAPLGGAVFVFEELTGEFRTRLVVAVLAGTATAMAVSHYLVGWDAVFPVPSVETGAMWQLIVYAAFGLVVGLLGVAYNRLVLLLLDAFA